jgi:hypothetical protein
LCLSTTMVLWWRRCDRVIVFGIGGEWGEL